jgi:hypothetical protein
LNFPLDVVTASMSRGPLSKLAKNRLVSDHAGSTRPATGER